MEGDVRQDSGEGFLETGLVYPAQPDYRERMRSCGYDPDIYRDAIINDCRLEGSIRDAWILCMTIDPGAEGRAKFGAHIVEIVDVWSFFEELTVHLAAVGVATQCMAGMVDYGDRTLDNPQWNEIPPPMLKPPRFEGEREFRFVWMHDQKVEMTAKAFSVPTVTRYLRVRESAAHDA